jgi:hypothetical protein
MGLCNGEKCSTCFQNGVASLLVSCGGGCGSFLLLDALIWRDALSGAVRDVPPFRLSTAFELSDLLTLEAKTRTARRGHQGSGFKTA